MNLTKEILAKVLCVMVVGAAIILAGCGGNSTDSVRDQKEPEGSKADIAEQVREGEGRLAEDESGKAAVAVLSQEESVGAALPGRELFPEGQTVLSPEDIRFYYPNSDEEENFLKSVEKTTCSEDVINQRQEESPGLVDCIAWKAKLQKADTLLEMNVHMYADAEKAWAAINRVQSTGGFIAGNVTLAGQEQWPETPEGQLEARKFIRSYYGRIRPVYVYKNEQGMPEDFLLENERQIQALSSGQ